MFKLGSDFIADLRRLEKKIDDVSEAAMQLVVDAAENDAKAEYRWNKPGTYSYGDWTWQVTGLTAETLTGYVVSARKNGKQLPAISKSPTVSSFGELKFKHSHFTDESITGDHTAGENTIIGILTMYSFYSQWLQEKEISGGKSGSPSAGNPITIDIFQRKMANIYVPVIMRPYIEKKMDLR